MELDIKIKESLIKMDFVKRYEELSKKFDAVRTPSNNRLIYIDCEEIMEMNHNLGYFPQFDVKEKFYKIKEEQVSQFTLWGTYTKRLINANYRIKKPVFGTYEDIEEILRITFDMYEDFKHALIIN